MRTVVIMGIPGTGKTTVCGFVEKLAKKAGVDVNVLNYGTLMLEILEKSGKVMGRDAMRKDDVATQRDLQRRVAEEIALRRDASKKITIVDTHVSINTPEGYFPGMSANNLPILKPDILVLVEARPSEISSRRRKDATRRRDAAEEEMVSEELDFSRAMAAACGVLVSVPVKVVANPEGRPEEAAKIILRALGIV